MDTKYYIEVDGKPTPTDMITWAKSFEKTDRIVQRTEINDKYLVSTVFLGLNHRFGKGPPLLYETMVFPMKSGKVESGELDMARYATRQGALIGHRRMVKRWRKR